MTAYRLMGCKDSSLILYKINNSASYNDVRFQNIFWFNMLMSKPQISKGTVKHLSTNITIDNDDGHEEATTSLGTSYSTNQTCFHHY